jgi:MFS family permease
MGETIFFCFVFLGQVLLISWLFPRQIISKSRYARQNFPPSLYPKAYTHPPEDFERWRRNIARVNLVIVVAGLLIIGLILGALVGVWDGGIFAPSRRHAWPVLIVAPFFIVQLGAGVSYIAFSSRKFRQALAKAPPPRVRVAELHRRQLLDFVSPTMLIVVALMNAAFITLVLYYYRHFDLPWFKAVSSIATVALALSVFSVSVSIAARAPKPDPYQAHKDRLNVIRLVVQQALTASVALPALLAALLTLKLFGPRPIEPAYVSLYMQGCAVALLWPAYRYRVDKVNFDVYKQDAGDSTPDAS